MALPSRLCRFEIELADVDRHVYETLSWRVPQHPSEDTPRLVTRVLARALLLEEGLDFGGGLSTADEPAMWKRSPHGRVELWVDIGSPSAERLHKASKAATKVIVVSHKAEPLLAQQWSGKRIHKAEDIEVVTLDPAGIAALADDIERHASWVVSRTEGQVHVATGSIDVALEWVTRPLTQLLA